MASRYFFAIVVWLLLLFASHLTAQKNEVLLTNSKKINTDRYKGILDSPYLFDEWHSGTIFSQNADKIEANSFNYNAHTNTFEIQEGDRFIELDPAWYVRVVLTPEATDPIIFQKAFHPTLNGQFMQLLYDGEGQLFKQVESNISEKTFQDVGQTRQVKRFVKRTTYHWIKGGALTSFKLNKKQILKSLQHKKALEKYIKQQKLKLNKEEHLVLLMSFFDEGGFMP